MNHFPNLPTTLPNPLGILDRSLARRYQSCASLWTSPNTMEQLGLCCGSIRQTQRHKTSLLDPSTLSMTSGSYVVVESHHHCLAS